MFISSSYINDIPIVARTNAILLEFTSISTLFKNSSFFVRNEIEHMWNQFRSKKLGKFENQGQRNLKSSLTVTHYVYKVESRLIFRQLNLVIMTRLKRCVLVFILNLHLTLSSGVPDPVSETSEVASNGQCSRSLRSTFDPIMEDVSLQ